jgi:cysteinyl-tRNA synthetase
MSVKYLGDRFDVHTGGVDLVFPHHEDEIAQSDGAAGHRVVATWVHGGHLRVEGQKMAKSAGNVYSIDDVIERGFDSLAFRLLCFQTRYRSEMNFTWDAMEAAHTALVRWRQRMAGWADAPRDGLSPEAKEVDGRFREAVGDDLDLPRAVTVVNEVVHGDLPDGERYALLASWDAVLGLDLERLAREGFEVPDEVRVLVEERDRAREDGDYARSDEIRDRLTAMGWEVMDTAEGTKVRPLLGR